MCTGAPLGPEMPMIGLGCGIGAFIRDYVDFEDPDDSKLIVLAGAAGAFGAVLNSPICGTIVVIEIGAPPKDYMESTTVLAFAAICAYCVVRPLVSVTFAVQPEENTRLRDEWTPEINDVFIGILIGIISSFIAILFMIFRISMKQVFVRTRLAWPEDAKLMREVTPLVLGGSIIGFIMYWLPLTVSYGFYVFNYLLTFGPTDDVSVTLLALTIIFRLLSTAIAMTCGFRGGIFISCGTTGLMCGILANKITELPLGLCVGCFIAGIPSGITAMPLLYATVVALSFSFDAHQSAPIFAASLTSYLFAAGIGALEYIAEIPNTNFEINLTKIFGSENSSNINEKL